MTAEFDSELTPREAEEIHDTANLFELIREEDGDTPAEMVYDEAKATPEVQEAVTKQAQADVSAPDPESSDNAEALSFSAHQGNTIIYTIEKGVLCAVCASFGERLPETTENTLLFRCVLRCLHVSLLE